MSFFVPTICLRNVTPNIYADDEGLFVTIMLSLNNYVTLLAWAEHDQ